MYDDVVMLDKDLTGLSPSAWKETLTRLARAEGLYEDLGERHFATLVTRSSTLLVTFETYQGIMALSEQALPLGFEMVRSQDWSHLCVMSDGDTWFRDEKVYELFDRLTDDGFFDNFSRVLFFGAGPCGYAAAAFSVAAPGARVLALQPQATLDPREVGWDERFTHMRKSNFGDRYGYAPDMIEAAASAYVLYDPRERFDAMHAALFRRPNVMRLAMPNMGDALQSRLIEMDMLYRLLVHAASGKLNQRGFARLYRARRDHMGYLRNLLRRLDADERPYLSAMLCANVLARHDAPKFRRRLTALENKARDGSIKIPGK